MNPLEQQQVKYELKQFFNWLVDNGIAAKGYDTKGLVDGYVKDHPLPMSEKEKLDHFLAESNLLTIARNNAKQVRL